MTHDHRFADRRRKATIASQWKQRIHLLLMSMLVGVGVISPPIVYAATITVVNLDSAGEGFNDPTPVAPSGGNPGTTRGAQRLNAFQHAASIWGGLISSPVVIRVRANFDVQPCSATSTVLGSAGPLNAMRDFTWAPVANTWYPAALANALHGSDLDPSGDDIGATFNSAIGTTCAFPTVWYYGLDANPPNGTIDFVTVVMHELGHGLGFLTFVSLSTGAKMSGFNDAFMLNLERHGASPPDYPSMSNAQRVAASTDTGNLHWIGPNAEAASGVLTAGRVGTHVRMYAPNSQQSGSSVSHWDTALTPSQLMEPSYTGPLHDPELELPLFQDIGWTTAVGTGGPPGAATLVSPTGMISTATPIYTWSAVSGATNYLLWVNDSSAAPKIDQVYTATAAGCASGTGTCAVTPGTAQAAGAGRWWIQTSNGVGAGPWSVPLDFTVNGGGLPGAATLGSPAGTIGTTTPTYTWNAVAGATFYYLWVNDSSAAPKITQWYSASDAGCGAGTESCAVTPSTALAVGEGRWWIHTLNAAGYGPWSTALDFTVAGGVPAAATLVSPTGTIGTATPTYTWNAVPAATYYYLWVNDSSAAPKITGWYSAAAAGCGAGTGTCTATPSTTLAAGAGRWWIHTWNPNGYGPWSISLDFSR